MTSKTKEIAAAHAFQAPDTARLMELAIQQGESGVAALERLVAMRERAEDRAAAQAYAAAMAQFQAVCPQIVETKQGAHGAPYEDRDGIMRQIRPALEACGLSVTFDAESLDDGRMRVWCIVTHAQGHSERKSAPVTKEAKSNRMNETQRDGSVMEYGMRYALGLALGISTGARDTDGGEPDEPITEEQAATLRTLVEEVKADAARFLRYFKIEAIAELPAGRYAEAVAMLERKRRGS